MPVHPLEDHDPRAVGPYRLTGRLGEGGQGVVYLGAAADGRPVAVKMLKTDARDQELDRMTRERLAEEVAAAMRVEEFCTAKVLDFAVESRIPYVVSEYVDGPSLFERVERQGPLSAGELTRLMITTASGLTNIHGAGVVHRDLKPSNVLLGPDGFARVVDFGIARPADKRTHTGRLVGTPAYFAPEQLLGRSASTASDVFAWAGAMVYAATGRAPFGHADYDHELPALFTRIREDPPDLRGVPERLLPLLSRCLAKDPESRPEAWHILSWLVNPSARVVDPAPAYEQVAENARDLLDGAIGDYWTALPPPGPPPEEPAPDPDAETPPPGPSAADASREQESGEQAPPGEPPEEAASRRDAGTEAATPGEASQAESGPGGPDRTFPPVGDRTVPPATGARRRPAPLVAALVVAVALAAGGWYLLAGRGGDGGGIPDGMDGTWTGQVSESDGLNSRTVDVTLRLTGGGTSGSLNGSRCAGALELAGRSGDRLTLRIAGGPCEGGTVIAEAGDGGLEYELRAGGDGSGHATLTKAS